MVVLRCKLNACLILAAYFDCRLDHRLTDLLHILKKKMEGNLVLFCLFVRLMYCMVTGKMQLKNMEEMKDSTRLKIELSSQVGQWVIDLRTLMAPH